ncbi:MAG TPA: phosphotransferase [Acidimicrobiales bacterium]|nr:phosphotransferase [Acidimicrobiales bacterium]
MDQHQMLPWAPPPELLRHLSPYLARRRWYAGDGPPGLVQVVESACLVELPGSARLLWAIVDAAGSEYQLVIGERSALDGAEHLKGHEDALIGNVGDRVYYGATPDSEMAVALLAVASDGEESAERARPLGGEQSNTSLVYDDRLILKLFRRLSRGPNPDVEVTEALAQTGFSHIALPLVRWRHNGRDLAFGQQYLAGGSDGWALALTSLRDLYGDVGPENTSDPALSGGDFAAEAARLGQMTADMHLAMAEAFGTSATALADDWHLLIYSIEARLGRLGPELSGSAKPLVDRLADVRVPGPAVRVHGDYHLGQVMRTDSGWYVLDFEGEPDRPLEERQRPTSVLKDVAGMLRSLQYASHFALRERAEGDAAGLGPVAQAWEDRNSAAFVQGYYETKGVDDLFPSDPEDREAVRLAFVLDKALYELGYEEAYRPDWVPIPLAALRRLLATPIEELLAGPVEPSDAGPDNEPPGT